MDNLSFAAGLGASMLSDKLDAARQQAAAAVEKAQVNAAYAAERAQQAAANVQANAASIDVTKVAANVSIANVSSLAESGCTRLRDSAAAAASNLEKVASAGALRGLASPGGGGGGDGGAAERPAGRPSKELEESSDSGGDDASWNATRFGGSFASRLGLGGGRSPEKVGLLPKEHAGDGSGDNGSGNGSGASGSWGAFDLAEMGLSRVRDTANAGLATASGLGTSVGSGLGLVAAKPKEPEGPLGKLCACCPTLTKGQRMLGFIVCFVFGGLLSLSALSSLPSLLLGNPAPFAFKYTFGNLLSLGSSSFVVGPQKQIRDMMSPERRMASIIYLISLFGTIGCVFVLKVQLLSFCFVVVQFAALTWYMLSYVPYGQQCLKRLIARLTR